MLPLRHLKLFSKMKPLKISGVSSKNGLVLTSKTDGSQFEVNNPLETLLGSLASCTYLTARFFTKNTEFKVGKANFLKIESEMDLEKFVKGGKQCKIQDVHIQAEIQTNGTQEQLDQLMQKVEHSCTVYCMLTSAGVKINGRWKNVPLSKNKQH